MRIKINDGCCEWEYDIKFDKSLSIDEVITEICYRNEGYIKRCRLTKEAHDCLSSRGEKLVKVKNKIWEYAEEK
jgi:hypothetical protein